MTEHINSHPVLTISGFIASIMITVLPSMAIDEELKLSGILLSIIVALFTIYAKGLEIKYRRMKIKEITNQNNQSNGASNN